MKKLGLILLICLLAAVVTADTTGQSLGLGNFTVATEDFEPLIWFCDHRVVLDDASTPGRQTGAGENMTERENNYAFEGEQIEWLVLAMDKNGKETINEVYVSVGTTQGNGIDKETTCTLNTTFTTVLNTCNARIDEEQVSWDADMMDYYTCRLTVESAASMHGQRWITVNVVDSDNQSASLDENEYWFLNPTVAIELTGEISFGTVRPGTTSYSDQTILLGNGAESGSGVMLDMFITGSDFTDPNPSGAKCPSTNQLTLDHFRYYAVNGAYSTKDDQETDRVGSAVVRDVDDEGYVNIEYGTSFSTNLYDDAEIIQDLPLTGPNGLYWSGNILSPGSEMAITFR